MTSRYLNRYIKRVGNHNPTFLVLALNRRVERSYATLEEAFTYIESLKEVNVNEQLQAA